MIDQSPPTNKTKTLTRAQRNKRDRQKESKIAKGRSLTFLVLDAQAEFDRLLIGRENSSKKTKRRASELLTEIDEAKAELFRLGFEPEEAVSSAEQYREFLKRESSGPLPVTSGGVGTYRLGNKPKNWT